MAFVAGYIAALRLPQAYAHLSAGDGVLAVIIALGLEIVYAAHHSAGEMLPKTRLPCDRERTMARPLPE